MDSAVQNYADMAIAQASAPNASAGKLPAGGDIDKTAENFEGMFMTQMLQPMFETVDVDPMFGGGHGEEIMRSFMVQEYGKILAKNSHFGIAEAVKREMIHAQQSAQAQPVSTAGGVNAYSKH